MSKRDWRLLFEDIIESINKIEKYTAGIEYDEFVNNSMISDAVVRNRIVHAYFGVDLQIIWFILQNELSKLKVLIERGMKDISS